jgi:FlaA1/EpsC-like NDP-sugar epimerase
LFRQLKNPKFYFMICLDAVLFALAHVIAYLFRFEFRLGPYEIYNMKIILVWFVPLKFAVFFSFGLYRGMWRYTSVWDVWNLFKASVASMLIGMAVILYIYRFEGYSRAVFLLDGVLTFLLTGGLRFLIRGYYFSQSRTKVDSLSRPQARPSKKVLIVGAGDAGEKILREVLDNEHLNYRVAGFVDDDPHKQGRTIHGINVLGCIDDLEKIIGDSHADEVLITIPSASGQAMRRIVDICENRRVQFKTLPGIGEIIDGSVSVKVLRDVSYEDLLGRPPVQIDPAGISNYIDGKTVLITGCGGSIGSELCRQVVRFKPRILVLLDSNEANLFTIQMELHQKLHFESCQAVLGQVQDESLMNALFLKYRPQVVFHAAAYKHVPMLEMNPWEAVSNNIQGSFVAMKTAVAFNVERFVLVSTDKAVRPTNVMGASKRVTELLLQSLQGCGTKFMAVRFGNVVGSSGSVIPIFRKQIERGGPVTVTHPEVTRYFMTIPEAAQLIIQAGAMGSGGEIFILEMGTPVKIADMARDLIRLSGKEPEVDVPIVFTGLRPGEKLYEELITSGEGIVETGHDKIMVLRADHFSNGNGDIENFRRKLDRELEALAEAANRHDGAAVKDYLQRTVQEYTPKESDSVL